MEENKNLVEETPLNDHPIQTEESSSQKTESSCEEVEEKEEGLPADGGPAGSDEVRGEDEPETPEQSGETSEILAKEEITSDELEEAAENDYEAAEDKFVYNDDGEEEMDLEKKQLVIENEELKALLAGAKQALIGAQPWNPFIEELKDY